VATWIRKLARGVESEPGTLQYKISRDPVDQTIFHIFEEYTGRKAFETHITSKLFSEFIGAGLLVGIPETNIMFPLKAL
jgi:quinol monooxygenase YgiN